MSGTTILLAMLGWVLLTAWLYRALGPRRGTLAAVVAGNLLVPALAVDLLSGARLQLTQPSAIGLALVVAFVISGGPGLARFRPHWLDLPMLAYVVYPVSGLLTNGPVAGWDVLDLVLQRGLGILAPYVAGRLYLGDSDGARSIAVWIVMATLAYVPLVAFEAVMGPRWYLANLIYGAAPIESMVSRLGGWRPEGFYHNGLILATWMAVAAVLAFWLWIARVWRPRWGPSFGPSLVLVLASLGCRGMYGYLALGLGLAAAALTAALRTRGAILVLLLSAPVYIGLRTSGAWDARMLVKAAAWTGRAGTIDVRLQAEDSIIARVLEQRPVLGFGVEIWHAANLHEPLGSWWPDGRWLIEFWTGGLVGLTLVAGALFLVPAGLALHRARPPARSGPAEAWGAVLALVLLLTLCLIDALHNNANFTPVSLAAGALVGIVVDRDRRRAGDADRFVHGHSRVRVQVRVAPPALDLSLLPIVASFACLLYVFAHAPVAGQDAVRFAGGLGAAVLFAASGGVGAWAAEGVPLGRLALFAVVFGVLGISFNLALHPTTRPFATADILQGLALSVLAVACWRRWVGWGAWRDALLVALPLGIHFLLGPIVPRFPGVQYLLAGPAADQSLFPLFPWLSMAALGARAAGERARFSGAAAAVFAAGAALAWWSGPAVGLPAKFPMSLTYALLSCAAAEGAFTLAHGIKRWPLPLVRRGAEWLGRHWLLFFYLHFAIAAAIARLRLPLPLAPLVWALMAAGSLSATWVAARAARAFGGIVRWPLVWIVPLGIVALAALWPGLGSGVVVVLAGTAGLFFAAYHEALAYRFVNPRPSVTTRPGAPAGLVARLGSGFLRLAALTILLALPELVRWVERPGPIRPAPGSSPGFGATPNARPDTSQTDAQSRPREPLPPRGTGLE